jgi:hypothetical protein
MRPERKTAFEDLQKRIDRGPQKPKAASAVETPETGSRTTIRLDHSRLLKIEDDDSIVEQITVADVITVRTHSNEKEQCLYRRPTAEMKAHGMAYNVQTLQFSVQNVKDLRHLTGVINRLKQES